MMNPSQRAMVNENAAQEAYENMNQKVSKKRLNDANNENTPKKSDNLKF